MEGNEGLEILADTAISREKAGKRHGSPVLKDKKRRRNSIWTDQERQFLFEWVEQNGKNWDLCSSNVNVKFDKGRSAKSCQSMYGRMESVRKSDAIKYVSVTTQTDISLGAKADFVYARVEPENVPQNGSRDYPLLRSLLMRDARDIGDFNAEKTHRNDSTEALGSTRVLHEHSYTNPYKVATADTKGLENVQYEHNYAMSRTLSKSAIDVQCDHDYVCKKKPTPLKKKPRVPPASPYIIRAAKVALPVRLLSATTVTSIIAVARTRQINRFARTVMRNPTLRSYIVESLKNDICAKADRLKSRKQGTKSILLMKNVEELQNIELYRVVEELKNNFPELFQLLVHMMLPKKRLERENELAKAIPRLAMIYGILMFNRNHFLSRLQRVNALCFAEHISDKKIYDRCNAIGISVSYATLLKLRKAMENQSRQKLVEAAREGKRIRFIGDNLNFMVGVKQENMSKHKHMEHMFASAALISERFFVDLPETPDIALENLGVDDIKLGNADLALIRKGSIRIVGEVIAKFLPQLSFIGDVLPKSLLDREEKRSRPLNTKTEVVPLSVLPLNEQHYKDVVQILDFYESIVKDIIDNSDHEQKFQIGGDQLTRERFSGGLLLRLDNEDPSERFAHLKIVTFEFFHLLMNYLDKMIFSVFWKKGGAVELGEMRCEAERLLRHSVDSNVMKAYEPDRDFFLSYVKAYIIEAALSFFGMSNRNEFPTKNVPRFQNDDEKMDWVKNTLQSFVDEFVFPCWTGNDKEEYVAEDEQIEYIDIRTSNGENVKIPLRNTSVTHRKKNPDKVKDYAHHVLEAGVTFMFLLKACKSPSRNLILAISKMVLLQIYSKNSRANYARELLRFLIVQISLLSTQEATQVLQSCFVNTQGRWDTHVPADLQMEWIVRINKSHVKHMFSNKSFDNIKTQSSGIPVLAEVGSNFDQTAGVLKRSQKHKKLNSEVDEIFIMDNLRKVKPFELDENRFFKNFKDITKSQIVKLDGYKFQEWFQRHKLRFQP